MGWGACLRVGKEEGGGEMRLRSDAHKARGIRDSVID